MNSDMMQDHEILTKTESNNSGSIEDIQDNVSDKLAKIFSFYNEQDFLDEIHGVVPAEIEVSVE